MEKRYVIDTDILFEYLHDESRAITFLENVSGRLFVSAISVSELYAGVREGPERGALEQFLAAFDIVEISADVAILAGLYGRDYSQKYGVKLADVLVAATAKSKNASLVTLNAKRYPMLKNVVVAYNKDDT